MRGGMRLGKKFSLIVNPVSWSKKGLSIRSYVNAQHPSNVAARLGLTEAAIAARGKPFRLINGIPYVATQVAQATAGKNYGGMSDNDRKQAAYAAANATAARLRARLSGRPYAGPSTAIGNEYF
jgi:hypothetical protein